MPTLTKVQRNEVFRALITGNLSPVECEIASSDGTLYVKHVSSQSRISMPLSRVNTKEGLFFVTWVVGSDPIRQIAIGGGFEQFVQQVPSWAAAVREWANTPDLWESLKAPSSILDGLESDSDNTLFTADEQAEIKVQLDSIADSIKKSYELTASQTKKLDEKIEEIKKDSKRLGRKDWKNIVIASFFALVLTDTITPGIFQDALVLLEHGIGFLFGGPPPIGGTVA